jgi:hypothetical protein
VEDALACQARSLSSERNDRSRRLQFAAISRTMIPQAPLRAFSSPGEDKCLTDIRELICNRIGDLSPVSKFRCHRGGRRTRHTLVTSPVRVGGQFESAQPGR